MNPLLPSRYNFLVVPLLSNCIWFLTFKIALFLDISQPNKLKHALFKSYTVKKLEV